MEVNDASFHLFGQLGRNLYRDGLQALGRIRLLEGRARLFDVVLRAAGAEKPIDRFLDNTTR